MQRTLTLAALAALCTLALTCKKEPPVVPPNGGPDTTSHNWTFTTGSIGEFGSYFRDVAILDDGTAWAVGQIWLRDSSGQIEPQAYNVARWNGQEWSFSRATNVALNTVFAFSANDAWAGSSAPYRWNGQQWIGFNVSGVFNGTINKIWGVSSNRMFIVGTNGAIALFNGTTWQRLESHTTVDLLDVWGSPDGSVVWACGYRPDYSESILLRYDGAAWQTIWKTPPPVSNQPYDGLLQTLWSPGNDSLYVVGGEGVWRHHPAGGTARKEVLSLGSFPTRVRGNAGNDLFIAGFDGIVWHFNGNTWRRFHSLSNPLHVYNAVALRSNTVIAVGADYSATIQRGLVSVGSRP